MVCSVATVAMSHTLTHNELTSAYPQLYLGIAAVGHSGLWVMAAVTAVTALNTFNGGFITASRFIYGTAREGSLPRQLAHLNDRAVPWVPVVVLGVVSAVVALIVAVTHAWQVLVAVGAALEAMIYGVAGFCALRLRTRQPDTPRPFRVRGLARPRAARHRGVRRAGAHGVGLRPEPLRSRLPSSSSSWPPRSARSTSLRVLPGIKEREAARRAARPRRRPRDRRMSGPVADPHRVPPGRRCQATHPVRRPGGRAGPGPG